ncbi:methionine sulfoxide reductase A [Vibrio sinaloensis]|uniref:peptide-methionine (S)-S-oxide reductase n=1 Tax=Photobacterium sp. (strain ATCC 43367) TaxID=379097 RepID=UPI00057CC900|nr:peptide-methionine (S)-S-oxide reductase [Vibrio sinaloensis]KIE21621.1 methionine sulfoxide reductase A [Vibrio sinaloensis]
MQTIYLAGGCLWGVQEFLRHLPGVISTQAGRANGTSSTTNGPYDGYAECVRVEFDPTQMSVIDLVDYLFEIIDPYSLNQQGNDVGEKYRTGIYSDDPAHLSAAKRHIEQREDSERVVVEIKPLTNYVKSDDEHQDRLSRFPNDYCHIPIDLLHKYREN